MKKFLSTPEIHVGIVSSDRLEFTFHHPYLPPLPEGTATAMIVDGQIEVSHEGQVVAVGVELVFSPMEYSRSGFGISDVLIGIGFHWEQKEDQHFPGALKLIQLEGKIQAINLVSVEHYLACVISSEMRADSPPALLKAHTIISRSWLLAQVEKRNQLAQSSEGYEQVYEEEGEYIRWYDREDHQCFDVCADDHCQRYQGISRSGNTEVLKAVKETAGEVLIYKGSICDARFSKCCGGVVEEFQNCWEDQAKPYLKRVDDNPAGAGINMDDLKVESNAQHFIKGSPVAFCNTSDGTLLARVLNDYDHSSTNFFRWEQHYSQDEISSLIREKSGFDFGKILDLLAVERGESGRLVRLKIVGSRKTMVVGKELEIRRWLSSSHLYSSAFIVEKQQLREGVPGSFILRGAGWGHGVGLCQIGAAVMAHRDYTYEAILKHYFINAEIKKLYE